MKRETAMKILSLQEQLWEREEYRHLLEEYRQCDRALLTMVEELSDDQKRIVWDFLGVGVELHIRMLSMALEME